MIDYRTVKKVQHSNLSVQLEVRDTLKRKSSTSCLSSVGVCVCMCVNVFLRAFVYLSFDLSLICLFVCLQLQGGVRRITPIPAYNLLCLFVYCYLFSSVWHVWNISCWITWIGGWMCVCVCVGQWRNKVSANGKTWSGWGRWCLYIKYTYICILVYFKKKCIVYTFNCTPFIPSTLKTPPTPQPHLAPPPTIPPPSPLNAFSCTHGETAEIACPR